MLVHRNQFEKTNSTQNIIHISFKNNFIQLQSKNSVHNLY